ncbi:MAG: 2-amino-4-hydroxy-6-hydroxymethyldihydropteridine diphosphokinase [Myxococcota bacterium]|nr:2-amino-4-hydroxy-6-hydroxymethyldihydropteridine diphosphokinase [Myxococcota bacterium]
MAHRHTAYVALGSNLGDRAALLVAGREGLAQLPESRLVGASSVYETAPVGPVDQGTYLNAVVVLETGLAPLLLLRRMLEIEAGQGRQREAQTQRLGPRTLDLDLLLYGDACVNEPGLEVPHPRLHQRAFVLEPLCEVGPKLIHPRLGKALEFYRKPLHDPQAASRRPDSPGWLPLLPERERPIE